MTVAHDNVRPWRLIGVVWAYVIVWKALTDLVKMACDRFSKSSPRPTPLTAHAMPLR